MKAVGWRDAWRIGPPDAARRRGAAAVPSAVGAAILGSAGPVAAVWANGENGRQGAGVVVVTVAALVLALSTVRSSPGRWVVVGGVVGAGAVAAHGSIGATPILVAAAGAAVAVGVLSGPRRWWGRSWPAPDQVALLAVPLVVAAQVRWAHGAGLAVFGVLATLAALVAVGYQAVPAMGTVDRWFRRATVAAVAAVNAVVVAVVAIPLIYLPGLVLRPIAAVRRRRAATTSAWSPRPVHVSHQRRDARVPFAGASPAALRRQRVVGAVAALVVGAVVVNRLSAPTEVVRQPIDPYTGEALGPPQPTVDPDQQPGEAPLGEPLWSTLDAGAGLDWADQAQLDAKQMVYSPDPIGGFSLDDLATETINVTDGIRRTIEPAPCDCEPIDVWVTGGSAAWGTGQRDEHTIASELVRLGDADGRALRVRNVAMPGWTLWQQRQGLLDRLGRGEGPPDVLVVYDGFNDMTARFTDVVVGEPRWDEPAIVDSDIQQVGGLESLAAAEVDARFERAGGTEATGRRAGAGYQALSAQLTEEMGARGVRVERFFQPDAAPGRKVFVGLNNPPLGNTEIVTPIRLAFDRFVEAALGELDDRSHNLRHLFDDDPGAVFFDHVHTNEAGAARSAREIYRQLGPTLDDLER